MKKRTAFEIQGSFFIDQNIGALNFHCFPAKQQVFDFYCGPSLFANPFSTPHEKICDVPEVG
jgi:hypothetical protein